MLHNLTIQPYFLQTPTVSFLGDRLDPEFSELILPTTPDAYNRYPIRVIVIGIPPGVTSIIHELYTKQFAQVYEWSSGIQAGQPGEIMKVMTRYFVMNS